METLRSLRRFRRNRFPPPWSVEETDACFVVRDHNGQALAWGSVNGGVRVSPHAVIAATVDDAPRPGSTHGGRDFWPPLLTKKIWRSVFVNEGQHLDYLGVPLAIGDDRIDLCIRPPGYRIDDYRPLGRADGDHEAVRRRARPGAAVVVLVSAFEPTIGPRGPLSCRSFDVRCWQMRTFQLGHFGSE